MKIDIRPYNENKQAHGYWETYWYNEQLWHKAFYEYDNEIGYEEYNPERYKKYYI